MMKNMLLLRSLSRAAVGAAGSRHVGRRMFSSRALLSVSALPKIKTLPSSDSLVVSIGGTRSFSEDVTHKPLISDPEVERAFKDLLAVSWDDLPNAVIYDVKNALSKNSEDKSGQEVLRSTLRAAEAVEEFADMVIRIKMELDDLIGMSGENVSRVPEGLSRAIGIVFERYMNYIAAFGPEESYLRKKVENELGSKMIFLKMRVSLPAKWSKVSVLATSGLSGSYVEHRA